MFVYYRFFFDIPETIIERGRVVRGDGGGGAKIFPKKVSRSAVVQ